MEMKLVEDVGEVQGQKLQSSCFVLLDEKIQAKSNEFGLLEPTKPQESAIPKILSGKNLLIVAPTGSGKTEAALLPIFHGILADRKKGGIRALYVTPLRALNRDMQRRIARWGASLGISVAVRHGDTPQKERRKQSLSPPEILITTPETLQVLLIGSRLRRGLQNVDWVVVDEIHELASDRRGAQLSLGLERLELAKNSTIPVQRIGLSATVQNKQEIARFLSGTAREVEVVDQSELSKIVSYRVEMPEPTEENTRTASEIFASPQSVARFERIAENAASHIGTLVFVNSRTVAEFVAARLSLLGTKAGVHHGSLPREERERVESEFKNRKISTLICTSTLELGIDIGSVDLAIQYMSPRQVNSLVQRVGRSGHSLSRASEGITLAVSPEDSIESIVIGELAQRRNLEETPIHYCALDVLAHQAAGLLIERGKQNLDEMLSVFKRSYPYRNLSKDVLKSVLSYMQTLGYLRLEGEVAIPRSARCRSYYLENLSTIPDERRYTVLDVSTQQKVGILGEEFMTIHARVGVHFIIKGRVWNIEAIQRDTVYVTPVKDPTASVPGWDGELLPIPENIALAVARARTQVEANLELAGGKTLLQEMEKTTLGWNADKSVRSSIIDEVERQRQISFVPSERRIVVESYDRYLIIHTSRGDRINQTLGELFEEILLRKGLVRHWWSDGYRILIELTSSDYDANEVAKLLFDFKGEGTRGFLNGVIRKHFPFGYYMKFVAERFGALKRGQMLSEGALKELVVKFRFTPVYEETLREALLLKVDIEGSLDLLKSCQDGRTEVKVVKLDDEVSPLAMYILTRYTEMEREGGASLSSVDSMREAISKEIVSLLCFRCGGLAEFIKVGSLPEEPACSSCSSPLMAVLFYGALFAQSALKKRMEKRAPLSEQEMEILTRARRSADLVLSYGKAGILAQCVYGVGPQTASKVLSKMHVDEASFYEDLLEAKLNFIRTRQYWD